MLSLERQNRLRDLYRREHPQWRPATEVYAAHVRRNVTGGSRLLDLGCGRGGLVEQLGHPLCLVVGLDPDLRSLQEHRLPLPRIQGLSNALPFATGSFDLVFSSWLLEHLQHPAQDLAEIGRVLRSGGAFVFVTPNQRHPLALLNRLLGRLGVMQRWLVRKLYARSGGDTFLTFYRANDRAALVGLARGAGLRLETLETIADPTYLAFTPAFYRAAKWIDARLGAERQVHLVGLMRKA